MCIYAPDGRWQHPLACAFLSSLRSTVTCQVELKSIERASFGHPEPSAQLAGEPLTRLESRRASEDVRHSVCSSACEVTLPSAAASLL